MSIAVGYEKINQIYYNGQGVDKIYKGEDLVYNRSLQNKFEYFYVYASAPTSSESAQHVGTLSLINKGNNTPNLEYSRDGVNWTTWDYSALTLYGPVEMTESSPVYNFIFFRGYNPNGFSQSTSIYSYFSIFEIISDDAYITVGGNIMSLLYKDSFWKEDEAPNNTIPNNYCFYRLFYRSSIYSCLGRPGSWMDDQQKPHPLNPLRLLATTITTRCYSKMFENCNKLSYGPIILPAKQLAFGCYEYMFNICSNLTKAPVLPASVLANYCYYYMFNSCSKLNYIKITTVNITGYDSAFGSWVNNVSSTGTFVKKRGVTYPSGIDGIPEGWTVEEID